MTYHLTRSSTWVRGCVQRSAAHAGCLSRASRMHASRLDKKALSAGARRKKPLDKMVRLIDPSGTLGAHNQMSLMGVQAAGRADLTFFLSGRLEFGLGSTWMRSQAGVDAGSPTDSDMRATSKEYLFERDGFGFRALEFPPRMDQASGFGVCLGGVRGGRGNFGVRWEERQTSECRGPVYMVDVSGFGGTPLLLVDGMCSSVMKLFQGHTVSGNTTAPSTARFRVPWIQPFLHRTVQKSRKRPPCPGQPRSESCRGVQGLGLRDLFC